MAAAAFPSNESERIALLHALDLLDTPAEPVFDRINVWWRAPCEFPLRWYRWWTRTVNGSNRGSG